MFLQYILKREKPDALPLQAKMGTLSALPIPMYVEDAGQIRRNSLYPASFLLKIIMIIILKLLNLIFSVGKPYKKKC